MKIKTKKLKEVCEISKGKKVKISETKTKNSIPYLLIDTLRGDPPKYFTEDEKYTEAKEDDILMVFDGANSGLSGTGLKGAVGSTIGRLRFDKSVISKYISYFLFSNFQFLNKDMKGSAIPHVKPQKLLNLEIRLPEKEEQNLIVQAMETQFSRLDESINSLNAVKKKLEVYRKAVLKKAFEKEEGWKEKKIKEISNAVEYGTSKRADVKGKIPVIRMGNLQKGKICFDKLKFYNSLEDIEHLILKKGDLLFNRTNSYELVGKTSIFNGSDFKKVTFASYLIRIVVNDEQVIPKYLNHFLNSPSAELMKNNLKSQQVGQANINGTKLKNIVVPLPSTKEQRKIVSDIESKFSIIDKVEQTINQSLIKSEQLRKSILKKAFEGELIKPMEIKN